MHTDHARSCNIRNGIGSGVKLPNRSGWIRKNDLPDKLGNIKDKFKKKYPAYSQTIYPTKTGSANSTIWNWDPNNDDNQPWWGIPWPPYEGRPPFPGNWSSGDLQFEFDTPERQRREGWQPKPVDDPAYRYQSDSDSADDLKPDEDDLEELAEEKQELLPDKKRRRQGTTAASSARGAGDDGAAGPATKRAKKSPPGKDGKSPTSSLSCLGSNSLLQEMNKARPRPALRKKSKVHRRPKTRPNPPTMSRATRRGGRDGVMHSF